MRSYRNLISASLLLVAFLTAAIAQRPRPHRPASGVSSNILIRILRAEDERRWDDNLKSLLSDNNPRVRQRAALAAGRIGDEQALPVLIELLKNDPDNDVRQRAAFAIGEVESPNGGDALLEVLGAVARPSGRAPEVSGPARARAVEALGKSAATLPESEKERKAAYGAAIVGALRFEADRRSRPDTLTILLGLTAVLRAKPEGAGSVVTKFLGYADPHIVAAALNTMARLRLKDNNEEVRALLRHSDPIVRANAARVIGAAEDKGAFDAILDRALHDDDLRVRVSAIRALGSLKDVRAAEALLVRGNGFLRSVHSAEKNELLEIITTLGRILPNTNNSRAVDLLKRFRIADRLQSSETEIAFARISPETYLKTEPLIGTPAQIDKLFPKSKYSWRASSSLVQGLAEFANLPVDKKQLRRYALADFGIEVGSQESHDPKLASAIPAYLRAYAAFKAEVNAPGFLDPPDSKEDRLSGTLRGYVTYKEKTAPEPFRIVPRDNRTLGYNDVFVRATAAELLAEQPASKENTEALITALTQALQFDKHDNDAALAILDALGKQKSAAANEAVKTALASSDHLIRRKAVAVLKANGAGDFSSRIGYVQTRNTEADYRRAVARIGKKVTATVVTSKGAFVIEFLPEDAPLTVDNFVLLARKGYFNGQTVPRVVPNFVIQTGDPRGDQNGGPGYSIRCEINEAPYERAAVGMALSGKDTGGSQWFVTHSPQPHLDGGYTVFGRVTSGMDVVDRIARGDTIRRIIVNER